MPVWAIARNGEYFSGHIDVLTFYNDMIIIGDYKLKYRIVKEKIIEKNRAILKIKILHWVNF